MNLITLRNNLDLDPLGMAVERAQGIKKGQNPCIVICAYLHQMDLNFVIVAYLDVARGSKYGLFNSLLKDFLEKPDN